MGFGLMLAGYFTLTFLSFSVGDYAFASYIIGGAVSFFAAGKLYEYKHRFGIVAATSIGWMLMGVYGAVLLIGDAFLLELPLPGLKSNVPNLILFVLQTLHATGILWATGELARQVGARKVLDAIPWSAGFTGLYVIGQIVLLLFPQVATFQDQTVTKLVLLVQLVSYLVTCFLLLRAFRQICPADGESTPRRSRFGFVNRIHDQLEERSTRAMQETMEYRRQRNEARHKKGGRQGKQ